jgi:hypothetical protein
MKRKLLTFSQIQCNLKKAKQTSQNLATSTRPSPNIPNHAEVEPFRRVLGEIFLESKISALDANRLGKSAFAKGTTEAYDFARAGNWGSNKKNISRDINRKLVQNASLPPEYWHEIQVWDTQSNSAAKKKIPFLLPHEVMHNLVQEQGIESFLVNAENNPMAYQKLQETCSKYKKNMNRTIAIGVHGDGVPYTKKDSIEILSWNFLSCPTADRIPITAVSKKHTCRCGCKGSCTWNGIFKVVSWSLKMLCTGQVSLYNPEGQVWSEPRQGSGLCPGSKLACNAFLLQVRGDWPFLRSLFHFPAWNSSRICWKCEASLEGQCSYKQAARTAGWRKRRLSDAEFLEHLRSQHLPLNPILQVPGFSLSHIVLDWLHVVDLGVGADAVGNLFWEAISVKTFFSKATKAENLLALWSKLDAWYKENKPASRLDDLTETMIKKSKDPPKLQAKGAECRYLIPFCAQLSQEFAVKAPSAHQTTVASLFEKLHIMQKHAAGEFLDFDAQTLAEHCKQFCLLYEALSLEAVAKGQEQLWKQKPKVHLLQELCEYQTFEHGCPRDFWCYRDESWCGFWAKASKRKGGPSSASIVSQKFLHRYRAYCNL